MNIDTTTVLQIINSNDIKVTDWLQAIGTLVAATGAIVAFVTLFKKDKQKQEQIDKLIEVTGELKNQTTQFAVQTEIMRESNTIFKEQVQLQNDVLIDDKEYKNKMKEIKEREQKAKFRPIFKFDMGQSSAKTLDITIKNYGEAAILRDFNTLGDDKLFITTPKNITVVKNGAFHLTAQNNGEDNLHKVSKLIEVIVEDSIGTYYSQIFNVQGSQINIQEPKEIK